MANRQSSGYGLKPVNTLGNTPATGGQSKYTIKRAHGTAIYNGEPVKMIVNTGSGTGHNHSRTTGFTSETEAACPVEKDGQADA